MNELTIRKKLYLVFGVLILIFVCNGIYSGYMLNRINEGALRIATEHLQGGIGGDGQQGGHGKLPAGRVCAGYGRDSAESCASCPGNKKTERTV